MFLAAYKGKIRLMSYNCEPWLNEDQGYNDDYDDQKHSIAIFSGVLGERKTKDETKTKSTQAYNRRRFDADKLKNVQLLTKNFSSFRQFTLVM